MSLLVRLIDASVFLHAYLKPKRTLKPHETAIKEAAKRIVTRVNDGEPVLTTAAHLAEISNILEDHLPLNDALHVTRALCLRTNVAITPVAREDYIAALDESENHEVGLTDALAYVAMKRNGLSELYSFDSDFDRFPDIRRLTT